MDSVRRVSGHSGSKYLRQIKQIPSAEKVDGVTVVDVYQVVVAFGVTNPATAHAVKKLLCAGLRGKGTIIQDLSESIDAISRAIEIEQQALADDAEVEAVLEQPLSVDNKQPLSVATKEPLKFVTGLRTTSDK